MKKKFAKKFVSEFLAAVEPKLRLGKLLNFGGPWTHEFAIFAKKICIDLPHALHWNIFLSTNNLSLASFRIPQLLNYSGSAFPFADPIPSVREKREWCGQRTVLFATKNVTNSFWKKLIHITQGFINGTTIIALNTWFILVSSSMVACICIKDIYAMLCCVCAQFPFENNKGDCSKHSSSCPPPFKVPVI